MSKQLSFLMCTILVAALAGNSFAELLVHYGFDETAGTRAIDSTGGNDGTVYGGSWQTPGVEPQTNPGHLTLTGDDARVEVAGLPASVGDFTVMCWVKKTNMARFPWFVGTSIGDANLQICFEEEKVEGFLAIGCGGAWGSQTTGMTSFRTGSWRHMAFVRQVDTGVIEAYLDGIHEQTFYCGTNPIDLSTFMIGNWPRAWTDKPGSYRPLNGGFDDFAMWDETLAVGNINGSEPTTINYYRLNGVLLRESVQFDFTDSGAFEGVSTAALGVAVHNAKPDTTYTVHYAATGGTATAGADYNLTAGTLTFNPGETTKTIDIGIIGDGTAESDETIVVTLSNPTGGTISVGAKPQHTYTIYNGPPPALFTADSSLGDETSPSAEVEVILAYPTSETATVDYAVTGGTATGEADYQLAPGTLTFAPGDVSETISFTVLDDTVNEASEKIVIGLTGASNATVGAQAEHAYHIRDDEPGIPFDGMVWYHSEWPTMLDLTDDDELQWAARKYHQVVVRLPEQRLSQVGDVVEFSYLWKSDGRHGDCSCDHRGDGCDCFGPDITCLDGTSGDFHLGLFDSNGRGYVDDEYFGNSADVFNGYLGYDYRIYPHVDPGLGRLTDCRDEVNKPGAIEKRTSPDGALFKTLSNYEPLGSGELGGFDLAPGVFSPLTLRLERTAPGTIQVSITLNGITRTRVDNDAGNQPQKIDVFGMYFHHSTRDYDYATLAVPLTPRSARPYPPDGSEGAPIEVTLGWRPGTVADSYDVYFGETLSAVNAATNASPEFKGTKTSSGYTPRRLVMGQTYYWRVDDVTSTEALKGDVWSFTTKPCIVFENFNSYADVDALQRDWTLAGGAWSDLIEVDPSTRNSMQLQYYNRDTYKFSEVARTFEQPMAWNGSTGFGIRFRGDAANQGDKLYAVIEDAAGVSAMVSYDGGINDLRSENWILWQLDFGELSGLDLSSVKKLVIGVGDRNAGSPSQASGLLYVDDLGVCGGGGVSGCVCLGDLDTNSQVDLDDLQAVAGILLQVGSPFIAPVEDGHCGDFDQNDQVDLDDLQAVAGILLQAGSPFIAPCE